MKSSRMKFANKLKFIKAGQYLNQDRILQVLSAADGISDLLPKISNPISQITSASIWRAPRSLEDQIATVTEGEEASASFAGDQENVRPPVNQIPSISCGSDTGIGKKSFGSGFRRPDLNSSTLFDPKLLEAFELAVVCFRRLNDFSRESIFDDEEYDIVFPADLSENIEEPEEDIRKDENALRSLHPLSEWCPPGGEESVVFYTTTLRGIRKTFDDCNMIRFLLDSFKVKYYERDVSMHRQYRDELRRISAAEITETEGLPPVLFVKGRCIGGAQRVLGLHEQGKLRALFEGVPIAGEKQCRQCDGFRFLVCGGCRGSRRIVSEDGSRIQCLLCNENGLILCVDCS